MGIRSRVKYFLKNAPKQLERSRARGNASSTHWQRATDLFDGFDLVQADIYRQISGSKRGMIANVDEERTFVRLNSYPGYILNNKSVFAQIMSANSLPGPKTFATFSNGKLAWEKTGLKDAKAHLNKDGRVIIKPTFGTQGQGIQLAKSIAESEAYQDADSIVTEFIHQADYSANIFADSLNTIRILSVRGRDGDHVLAGAVHRFGTSRSAPVDNMHAGGIAAEIHRESGILSWALDRRPGNSAAPVEHHPETGSPIAGVQVEFWEDVKRLNHELGRVFSYFPIVGWDIAITPDGPSVIEGNAFPGLALFQFFGPFSRDPFLNDLLSQYFPKLNKAS